MASVGACDGSVETSWNVTRCTAGGCTDPSWMWVMSAVDGRVLNIPGALGPSVIVYPQDDPTGTFHNELWRWDAASSTIVCLDSDGPPYIYGQCLTVLPTPPPPPPCETMPRAGCHAGKWESAPERTPSGGVADGPLLGNGDFGAVAAASQVAAGGVTWWAGKGDLWATNTAVGSAVPALHADTFYSCLSGAALSFYSPYATASRKFEATQDLLTATVSINTTFLAASGNTINATFGPAFVAADETTLVMPFSFSSSNATATEPWNVRVETQTSYSLPLSAGVDTVSPTDKTVLVWATKTGVRDTYNDMILMPCDTTTYVYYPSVSTFQVDSGSMRLRVLNQTSTSSQAAKNKKKYSSNSNSDSNSNMDSNKSMNGDGDDWLCPVQVEGSNRLSIAPCGDGGVVDPTDWQLVPASSFTRNDNDSRFVLQRAGTTSCAVVAGPEYHNSGGLVSVGDCGAANVQFWTWNATTSQLQFNATQCLTAVPPNVNVTLAVAAVLLDATTNEIIPAYVWGAKGSAAEATHFLKPNTRYLVVLTGATSPRDVPKEDVSPLNTARMAALAYIDNPQRIADRVTAHAQTWQDYWAASSIYLGEDRQLLEGFWYGMQYLLRSTLRPGAVFPGLWGVWAQDYSGWNGDYTNDYNSQANIYGIFSSNHNDLARPYLDLILSDWHMEISRRRASANWLAKGSAGGPGQTSQSMACGYMDAAYENPHICPNTTKGGYAGIEMTSHIGPFSGLYYFADLSLRVTAAMSLKPVIDYVSVVFWRGSVCFGYVCVCVGCVSGVCVGCVCCVCVVCVVCCVCVYIYIYIYIYMCVCLCLCIYVCGWMGGWVYVYACVFLCPCVSPSSALCLSLLSHF